MPKKIRYELSEVEQAEIKQALKTDKRPEVRQRATAIRLLSQEYKPKEVSQMLAVSAAVIYQWWHRFQAGGVSGLANKPHRPVKRKVDERYRQALEAVLSQEPSELGYEFAIWTRERLRDHLQQETGVKLSLNWLGTVMKEMGYEFRRPKHELSHLQDQAEKESAQVLLDQLKKRSSQTISSFSLWTRPP